MSGPESINQTSEETVDVSDDKEKLVERARLYRKFGKMALYLSKLDESKKTTGEENDTVGETLDSPEDVQADALIAQIENTLKDVDKSLGKQIDYSIINHKQINTKDALEHELQSGTSIPELDIRFDKDGKPWISHSPRAGTRFFFSKPIHTLSSEEVADYGQRLSLEDGLEVVQQYAKDNPDHRVVLELKELGPSADTRQKYLESIKTLLDQNELTDVAIFATLSPSILKSTHDVFPNNSKILNGGICPIISYELADKSLDDGEKDREFAMKAPNLELFFSNSAEIAERADGYGKQTGYLWTRLPKETVATLAELNKNGNTGAASLTLVNKFANILDKFSPKTAQKIREHYAEQLDRLGIKKQVAISRKNPAENLQKTVSQMGKNTILYSDTSPGEWAIDLPEKSEQE
ncbi:hypothetical protein IKF32_01055 [Candidatus Saccharibacteria bacterium]|nr:hypothetical protein [Candidatus Saccharibacteria bacterium]